MTWTVYLPGSLRHLLMAVMVGSVCLTPALAQQLEAVDANGIEIGDVDSIQSLSPVVAFNLDGRWFTLFVLKDNFASNSQLNFESVDCTGTSFLFDFATALGLSVMFSPAAIAPPGNTVFLPVPNATSELRNLNSTMFNNGTCVPAAQPVEALVLPVQAIEDLNTRFTPPFTLRTTP